MATSESEFKTQFRKDLSKAYPTALVFTNNDMFRAGLPDFSVLYQGSYFAIEGKFVSELPKRMDSKVLKHEVSGPQLSFLNKTRWTGNYAAIVVGMPDVAVLIKSLAFNNLSLRDILDAPRIERVRGVWQVKDFLERVRDPI